MIIGIAVLVVTAVGFAGFRVYKGRQLDAGAYSWSNMGVYNSPTVKVYGCQSLSDLPNGTKRATLRAYAKNTGTASATWKVNIATYGGGSGGSMGGTVSPGATTNIHFRSLTYTPGKTVMNATVNGASASDNPLFNVGGSFKKC